MVFAVMTSFGAYTAKAQEKYPKGLYMSYEEIVNKTPSVMDTVVVKKRTSFDIAMVGGNDYELKSPTITKKVLKKKAFAYSDGDTLYINCIKYGAQPWYAKVSDAGKYLVFSAAMSKESVRAGNTNPLIMSFMFGALGGALGGAMSAQERYVYTVELKENKFDIVTLDFLDVVLKDRDVYEEFQRDREGAELAINEGQKRVAYEVIANKYIERINK